MWVRYLILTTISGTLEESPGIEEVDLRSERRVESKSMCKLDRMSHGVGVLSRVYERYRM